MLLAAEEIVENIPIGFDIAAVSIGALSGALVAVRSQFDVSGILMLAIVTGVGGGLIRDTLLQQGPPVALTSPSLLSAAVIVGVAVFLFSQSVDAVHSRMTGAIVVVDAVFLATYVVVGTTRGLDANLPGVSCVLLGVLTGVGGGMLRDVLINEQPELLRPGGLVGMTAVLGSSAYVAANRLLDVATGIGGAVIVGIVVLRLAAVRRGWESPMPTDVLERARRLPPPSRWRARRRPADGGDEPPTTG